MKKNRIYKIAFILTCLATLFSATAKAGNPEEALKKLMKSPSIDPSTVAIVIADVDNGDLMASHNPDKALIPASIMKSATTAAMIKKNPHNKPLITKVYTDGPISDSTLNGNIVVIASGDPSLNGNDDRAKSADFVNEIVSALAAKGIKKIEGEVIIDESIFAGPSIPPTWQQGDLQYAYGTGSHGFNFEKNSSGKSSVKNPSEVFRKRLKTALSQKGITMSGKKVASGNRQLLLEHKSAPLNNIMRSCMVRSDNLYAESILRLFGKESGLDGSTEKAAEEAMKQWEKAGVPMENVLIVDGSGLSRKNRLTARFMTIMLTKMKGNKAYTDLFARVGKEGTVSKFLKGTPLEGRLILKTGSMSGVQCYAGYLLDSKGQPEKTVVVMVNNLINRDRFKKDLANYFLEIF